MAPKTNRRRSSMGTLSEETRNTLEAAAAASSNTAEENEEVEMSDEQKEEQLRRVQTISTAFHGFDDDDIRALATSIQVVAFKRGEDILRKGESASWFGIVLQGTLDVLVNVGLGLIFHIRRGDVFGEQSMFEANAVRSADVVAGSDGLMGLFTFRGLEAFVEANPALGLKMVRALGRASVDKLTNEKARVICAGQAQPVEPPSAAARASSTRELSAALSHAAPQSAFLEGFTEAELGSIAQCGRRLPFRKGDVVFKKGQELAFGGVVLDGELEARPDSSAA
eukprot:3893829-Prymnesium_polylepis.1